MAVTAALLILAGVWVWPPNWLRATIIPPSRLTLKTANPFSFDWEALPPSEELAWVPCYPGLGNFYCARLTVPMDYGRPLTQSAQHPKVHIALTMLPGANHSLESGIFSESPLLINPGGPGGSGTTIVLTTGKALQRAMAADQDIVGFDPRGIGATWPQTNCFLAGHDGDDPTTVDEWNRAIMNRMTWNFANQALDLINNSDTLFKAVTRDKALSALCQLDDGDDSIFKYVGTPHVAQDMLSIVQAWDKWTSELETAGAVSRKDEPVDEDGQAPPSTRGKLVYWGFSYGTFLGATFASMFRKHLSLVERDRKDLLNTLAASAESVGRLVLDGVVNSDVYFMSDVSPFCAILCWQV